MEKGMLEGESDVTKEGAIYNRDVTVGHENVKCGAPKKRMVLRRRAWWTRVDGGRDLRTALKRRRAIRAAIRGV